MTPPTEGFEVPIHRSLTEPLLVAGLPRTLTILLWTPGMVIILGFHQLWFIPLQLGLHTLLAHFTRQDPFFFEVFTRALRGKRRLEP